MRRISTRLWRGECPSRKCSEFQKQRSPSHNFCMQNVHEKDLHSSLERGMPFSRMFGVSKEKVSGTPFLKSKPLVKRISPSPREGVGGWVLISHTPPAWAQRTCARRTTTPRLRSGTSLSYARPALTVTERSRGVNFLPRNRCPSEVEGPFDFAQGPPPNTLRNQPMGRAQAPPSTTPGKRSFAALTINPLDNERKSRDAYIRNS
jgi:hypothetical protein